jgi:phosphoribosylformimino-5-aminoimidazole carboxamide ribotide isomerase
VIAIVDYGRGNLASVERAFARVGMPAAVTQEARAVDDAEAVVIPGDGAFHDAMGSLEALGLVPALLRALDGRRPFLGICLGYQLLFSASEEFGDGRGLGVVPGRVRRFPPGPKIPHMGWNRVCHGGRLRLFEGIPDGAHFYFVHSYYPEPAGFAEAGRARADFAWCDYGVGFPAAMEWGLVAATQFHPEKSQGWGIRLLENFAALVRDPAGRAAGGRGAGVPALRGEHMTRPGEPQAAAGLGSPPSEASIMKIIPAVDVREGRCVRLYQGRADAETVFGDDPVAMASRWASLGAERLHVVDLDGAFAGTPRQTALVEKMISAVKALPVSVGGGLRDEGAIEAVLAAGARWAVVGTRAALDARFLFDIGSRWPDQIVVAVDARGDRVAVKGWTEASDESVMSLARRARDAGAAAVLYTDVGRDGTGLGPNVEATAALARGVDLPVLASGGVARLEDLRALAAIPGVEGAVVGRALYTGAIELREATIAIAGRPACSPSA